MEIQNDFEIGDKFWFGTDDNSVLVTVLKPIENLEDLLSKYRDTPHYRHMRLTLFYNYLLKEGYVGEAEVIRVSDEIKNAFAVYDNPAGE